MAETMTTWHTLASARVVWPEAPFDDDMLEALLVTAEEQCALYAPRTEGGYVPDPAHPGFLYYVPEIIPERYRLAQIMQARALWLSTESNSSDQIGADGFTVTVYPMDRVIKNILRPRRGVPIVG